MTKSEMLKLKELKSKSSFIFTVFKDLDDESIKMLDEILLADNISLFMKDEELIETAKAFFDCNLNITTTSKKLFMHRNTLVYRLDKLKKNIGLDIREFDDALTLKILITLNDIKKSREINAITCVL